MAVKKLEKVKLAKVKLTKAFGHIIFSSLRTMTSGGGQFSMEFKKVMSCPSAVADALYPKQVEKLKAEKEAAKK
ncbi:hypothetical protein DS885_09865 [Psychromonas sp. B3M02]|uniref:hypothetical protein n=1 Tax=Psychromonas sp. B3M02 TaxID=2267226 RepID=UPI000DE8B4AB|nr:hypothetical protein [Psychromonas sp. B3M02]RBW45590.1 hypothetical protein DS885_09865 [Psychromonas sp. B3M02]